MSLLYSAVGRLEEFIVETFIVKLSNVPVKSKLQHPPRAFEFLEKFCSNSPSRGRKAVQMPHHRSIPGDQMPIPPGNFSVAFIMLRKLRM